MRSIVSEATSPPDSRRVTPLPVLPTVSLVPPTVAVPFRTGILTCDVSCAFDSTAESDSATESPIAHDVHRCSFIGAPHWMIAMFLAVMRPLDGNTMHVPVEVCYSKFLRRLRQAQP